ncbi:hypothetical protein [Salinivibrio costicola]|nr:hypothetical protein [Salinivibrio costicola]
MDNVFFEISSFIGVWIVLAILVIVVLRSAITFVPQNTAYDG